MVQHERMHPMPACYNRVQTTNNGEGMHHAITVSEDGRHATVVIEGVPAGLLVRVDDLEYDLGRGAGAYGMTDAAHPVPYAQFIGGLRNCRTTGAPVAVLLEFDEPVIDMADERAVVGRSGSPDLFGALKIGSDDCRDVSLPMSAARLMGSIAAASIAREFLAVLGVDIQSYVTSIGSASLREEEPMVVAALYEPLSIETSGVRCPVAQASRLMEAEIDAARESGDTLGGTFRIVATGLVAGLGSYLDASGNLGSRLAAAVMSVPGVYGVQLGLGFLAASMKGSQVRTALSCVRGRGFAYETNSTGGIEDGITSGAPLIIGGAVLPPAAMEDAPATVSMSTLEPTASLDECVEVCSAPHTAVVAEAEAALVLANAYLDKFGRDSMKDVHAALDAYKERIKIATR